MGKFIDLTGKKFGRLTVVNIAGKHNNQITWECKCECGNLVVVAGNHLRSGNTKSCGCLKHDKPFKDLSGQKFGKWTVIEIAHKLPRGGESWLCECECGSIKNVPGSDLQAGRSTSCGCNRNKSWKYQDEYDKRLYRIWLGMKNRCANPNATGFQNYGGRGITVCKEWENDYAAFYQWSISHGYEETLSLDRIDTNGNYEPSNCRWVTQREQCRNKRNNKPITVDGTTKCLSEWADEFGISNKTALARISQLGWDEQAALKVPSGGRGCNSGKLSSSYMLFKSTDDRLDCLE